MKKLLILIIWLGFLGLMGGCAGTGGSYRGYDYPYYGPDYGYYPPPVFYDSYYFGHFYDDYHHHPPAIHRPFHGRHDHGGAIGNRSHTVRDRHPGNLDRQPDRRITRGDPRDRPQLRERDRTLEPSPRGFGNERFSRDPGVRCSGPRC